MAKTQGDDRLYHPTRRRLLRDLTGAGIGVAGVGLIGREVLGQDGSAEVADAATPSCTLSPEVTEGPLLPRPGQDPPRHHRGHGRAAAKLDGLLRR